MTTVSYDGSFGGLLTAVFQIYERKLGAVQIVPAGTAQGGIFGEVISVELHKTQYERVWRGLQKKVPPAALQQLYSAFLSELPGWENQVLEYIRHAFSHPEEVSQDFGNAAVLWITQTARRVWREKHRMEAFVRFQKLGDGLFYSFVEPDFNVLPLISAHFKSRYADQDWMIYDGRRRWGISHSKATGEVREVKISWSEEATAGKIEGILLDAREELFQTLWRDYFKHTGIPARKNPKLHLQHIPVRYWKHLTEKMLR